MGTAGEIGATSGRPSFGLADFLLLFTALFWGVNFTVIKETLAYIPPLPLAAVRFAGIALLLLPLARRGIRRLSRREHLWLAGLGVVSYGIYQLLFSLGLDRIQASTSALLINLAPAFGALLAARTRIEPLTRGKVGGIALSLTGVYLLVRASGNGAPALSRAEFLGMGLTLAAAFLAAWGTVYARPLLVRHPPLVITALDIGWGALFLLAVAAPQLIHLPWRSLPAPAWEGLAYSILLSGALANVFWFNAVGKIGAVRTMLYGNLIPVVGVTTAVLWRGEPFNGLHLLGAALILAGVTWARVG